jgi:hypothetical protein
MFKMLAICSYSLCTSFFTRNGNEICICDILVVEGIAMQCAYYLCVFIKKMKINF